MPGTTIRNIQDISFLRTIKKNGSKSIFLVTHGGQPYILKVYHPLSRELVYPSYKESDLFKREKEAYKKLNAAGLCERGVAPRFIGALMDIDPRKATPFLSEFINDIDPINGVILEYVPNLSMYCIENFTVERSTRFHQALLDIHDCGVYHGDAWPRQMMVQESSGRILWLDFDSSQSFPPGEVPKRYQKAMQNEKQLVEYFLNALMSDAKEGSVSKTWDFYYE